MNDVPYAVFPEQIPPDLCTHIIIGFAKVVNYTLVPSEERDLEVKTNKYSSIYFILWLTC